MCKNQLHIKLFKGTDTTGKADNPSATRLGAGGREEFTAYSEKPQVGEKQHWQIGNADNALWRVKGAANMTSFYTPEAKDLKPRACIKSHL